jgi:hypothetical protein
MRPRLTIDAPRIWTPKGAGVVRFVPRRELWRALGLAPAISGGTLQVFSQGEGITFEALLNITAPQDLRVRLYTNNYTPIDASTEANFTEMGAVQSYAYVDLTAGNWVISGSEPKLAAYPQITWSFTAGGPTSIYGYTVGQQTSGKALWGELFTGGPFVVQNLGDEVKVTPKITLTG